MKRRYFLFGLPAAASRPGRTAARRKILIALLDGFGRDYFERSEMPVLKRIAANNG